MVPFADSADGPQLLIQHVCTLLSKGSNIVVAVLAVWPLSGTIHSFLPAASTPVTVSMLT